MKISHFYQVHLFRHYIVNRFKHIVFLYLILFVIYIIILLNIIPSLFSIFYPHSFVVCSILLMIISLFSIVLSCIAHIGFAKYCIHVKMGLILSLVSSSLHILLVGNESRVADILCQTALKYAPSAIIHRQQYPLTLASIPNNKHHSFIVSGLFLLVDTRYYW